MVTIFACPKPFRGHIEVIQRNALTSWTLLSPKPEVILFGDEPGTAETSRELGLRHIPEVERNEFGTPFIGDLFEKAQRLALFDILCYANCDIMFLSDFEEAVTRVSQWRRPFLMVGRRWDVNISGAWDFEQPDWEARLRRLLVKEGRQRSMAEVDYFVFSRYAYRDVPALAVGRPWWDHWMIWKARSLRMPVVDASPSLMAVHQNHDYAHHPEGYKGVYQGEEARRSYELVGGWALDYSIEDASHRLTPTGVTRNLHPRYFRRRLQLLRRWSIDKTRPLRRRLGLDRSVPA